jgi:hypothetical protein
MRNGDEMEKWGLRLCWSGGRAQLDTGYQASCLYSPLNRPWISSTTKRLKTIYLIYLFSYVNAINYLIFNKNQKEKLDI